jgi:hypothetical protein
MKKILSCVVVLGILLSLTACGGKTTPKDALTKTTDAKQGKMLMSLKLSSNTGTNKEEIKLLMDSLYGSSDDNKKIGVESKLTANYQGVSLEGMIDVNADLSAKEPKISLAAGVPASTLANFGAGMPTPVVVTLNEADFKQLLAGQNVDFNKTVNADTLKNNAETMVKVLKIFNDLKIEEPKDEGSGSVTIEGKSFEGEKYTAHITDSQIKGIAKAFVNLGMELEKTNTKSSTTANKATNVPTEQEINAQIDSAFKSVTFKDGINATMIVDKNGYLSYVGATVALNEPTSKAEVALDIALGFSDLDSSVKGMEYFDKNKTGMYKDATVIPIMQYLQGAINSTGKNSSSPASLFGLGN